MFTINILFLFINNIIRMKVEYLLQLFKSFNNKIWNNKVFSYFLIALVIGFTVILRKLPEIYYKYLLNQVLLLFVVIAIIIITSHNQSLGIVLCVCLIALYYPSNQINKGNVYFENFENENENETVPIEKTDKNIIDDEKPKKTKEPKEVSNKISEPTKNPIKNKENDISSQNESDLESQDENDNKSDSKSDTEEKISEMRLENLNPSYYNNKKTNSSNSSKKIVEKFEKSKPKQNNNKNNKNNMNYKSNNKSKSKPQNNEETFLGDIRQVVNDLDTGKNRMNANNAIKKISELMYNKHKTSIQKILDDNNDTDDEEESDDDI